MDLKKLEEKITPFFQKYKFVFLILLIGIILMMIPSSFSQKNSRKNEKIGNAAVENISSVQDELEKILSCMKGAGNVKVMLKESSGIETVYQTSEDSSVSDTTSSIKTNVITVTDSDRKEQGLVKQINPPKYQGAIILCQGADDPAVKLAITDAVSKITGLGADKIAVLKMM